MPIARATVSPRCSRSSTDAATRASGVSLLELLVALSVFGLILAIVVPMAVQHRRIVAMDQVRTSVNQTLRASHELIAADIRIAGERFGDLAFGRISPLTLSRDPVTGTSQIEIRRALEQWLPVCQRGVNGASIRVANPPGSSGTVGNPPVALPPECIAPRLVSDGTRDWPPNLFAWRERIGDATVTAYIHDPAAGVGQFFPLQVRSNSTMLVHCVPGGGVGSGCTWRADADYSFETESVIGLLEVIRYHVVDGVLLREDVTAGTSTRIAADIEAFDVLFTLEDGTQVDEFELSSSWRGIVSVDVSIETEIEGRDASIARGLTVSYFPRNVLSR